MKAKRFSTTNSAGTLSPNIPGTLGVTIDSFWRILANHEVDLLCAQVSGRIEVARGRLIPTTDGFTLGLHSSLVANDDGRVEGTWREFTLRGSTLQYSLKMQTASVSALTLHVHAQLKQNS